MGGRGREEGGEKKEGRRAGGQGVVRDNLGCARRHIIYAAWLSSEQLAQRSSKYKKGHKKRRCVHRRATASAGRTKRPKTKATSTQTQPKTTNHT
jgi:hypothetical protein